MHLSLHLFFLVWQLGILFHLQYTSALLKSLGFLSQADFCWRNFSHLKIIKPPVERGGNSNRLEISGGKAGSLSRKKELASLGKHDEYFGSIIFEFILSFIGLGGVNSTLSLAFPLLPSGQLLWGGRWAKGVGKKDFCVQIILITLLVQASIYLGWQYKSREQAINGMVKSVTYMEVLLPQGRLEWKEIKAFVIEWYLPLRTHLVFMFEFQASESWRSLVPHMLFLQVLVQFYISLSRVLFLLLWSLLL